MSEYSVIIFTTCLIFGVLSLLTEGDIGVKLTLGIITAWVILSPLTSLFSDIKNDNFLSSIKPDTYETESEYYALIEDAFADGVRLAVADKFDLNETDVRVKLSGFDREKMAAEKIRITLSGRAITADYKNIEEYINKMNLGECNVEIEIG